MLLRWGSGTLFRFEAVLQSYVAMHFCYLHNLLRKVWFWMLVDIIFFIFLHFLWKCAARPRWGAHFRRTIFANIACKKRFPYPDCFKNHPFSRSISALCCAKSNMFCRLSGKWPTLEALFNSASAFACILKQIFISSVLILPLFLGRFVDRRFYLCLHSGFQYPRPGGMRGAIEYGQPLAG